MQDQGQGNMQEFSIVAEETLRRMNACPFPRVCHTCHEAIVPPGGMHVPCPLGIPASLLAQRRAIHPCSWSASSFPLLLLPRAWRGQERRLPRLTSMQCYTARVLLPCTRVCTFQGGSSPRVHLRVRTGSTSGHVPFRSEELPFKLWVRKEAEREGP